MISFYPTLYRVDIDTYTAIDIKFYLGKPGFTQPT